MNGKKLMDKLFYNAVGFIKLIPRNLKSSKLKSKTPYMDCPLILDPGFQLSDANMVLDSGSFTYHLSNSKRV